MKPRLLSGIRRWLLLLAMPFLSAQAHQVPIILPPADPNWPPLTFLTEISPPGEVVDDTGHLTGPTVELIRVLQHRLNEPGKIQVRPWARAYQTAINTPNVALFETMYNHNRAPLFKWVGPLKNYRIALYGRSDKLPAKINPATMAKHLTACAYRQSAYMDNVKELGFSKDLNLIITSAYGQCQEMLLKGRTDLAVFNELSALDYEKNEFPPGVHLRSVVSLGSMQLYLTFSKNVPSARVKRWQLALQQSYLDGTMTRLYQGVYTSDMIQWLQQFALSHQVITPPDPPLDDKDR